MNENTTDLKVMYFGRGKFQKFAILVILFIIFIQIIRFSLVDFTSKNNEKTLESSNHQSYKNNLIDENSNFVNVKAYSIWDKYLTLNTAGTKYKFKTDQRLIANHCFNSNNDIKNITFQNFELFLNEWSKFLNNKLESDSEKDCARYLNIFKLIYDVKFKTNHLQMSQDLKEKVKKWLKNDDNLVNRAFSQKLVTIYNRYTFEENNYNTLRTEKPVKKSDTPADEYYKNLMNETKHSCDFCSIKLTAFSTAGRIETNHSYSSANLFPFDENHELFLPKKHNLFELDYEEFKDLMYLPLEWFARKHKQNPRLKYPVLLWDFLYKAGASQIHPHIHGTLNEKRYYGMFETLRNGAENYFQDTKRNYFNDFTYLHNFLGLSYVHKNAALVFSLTPKKSYDALIISENYNESVIELLYSLIHTYAFDMGIYPFSLAVYFPSLDSEDNIGRIPLYVKVVPRGEISSSLSDISSLELFSVFNSNHDIFKSFQTMKGFISKRLSQFEKN